jgi:uncharacterized protein (TIGR02594 family)
MHHTEAGDDALAPWMHDAWFYYNEGLQEIPGSENHPWIMDMHNSAVNGWIPPNDDDQGPWCSSFACYVVDNSYYKGEPLESPKNAYSLSWRNWGREIDEPVYGAIAVKTRSGGGHVTFVVGANTSGTQVAVLGGNQNNEVNITMYNRNVFRYFVPTNYVIPNFSRKLNIYTNGNTNATEQ